MSAAQWYEYLAKWHAWYGWRIGEYVARVDVERDSDDPWFAENVEPRGYVT